MADLNKSKSLSEAPSLDEDLIPIEILSADGAEGIIYVTEEKLNLIKQIAGLDLRSGSSPIIKQLRSTTTPLTPGSSTLAFGVLALTYISGILNLYAGNSSNIATLIGSSSSISGTGTSNQFAYFIGASTLSSSSLLSQVSSQLVVGSGDGSTPTSTTIRGAQSSGSSVSGANLTIQASNGTGAGGSGSIIVQTAPAVSSLPVVGTSVGFSNSNTNVLTQSVTVPSSSNRLLLVQVALSFSSAQDNGITYGGVPLTLLQRQSSGSADIETWYLLNPTPGTANLVLTLSNYAGICGYAINLSNVNQSTPFGTVSSTSGNGTSASLTPTSSVGQLALDLISVGSTNPSVSGGQTLIWSNNTGTGVYGDGSQKVATAGTTSMSYSWGGVQNWGYMAFAVNPPPATGSNAMINNTAFSNIGTLPVQQIFGTISFNNASTTTSSQNISSILTLVNSSSATTQTLPSASIYVNSIFTVKNINTGIVTVNSVSGNVDGGSSISLSQGSFGTYYSDGSNWWSLKDSIPNSTSGNIAIIGNAQQPISSSYSIETSLSGSTTTIPTSNAIQNYNFLTSLLFN